MAKSPLWLLSLLESVPIAQNAAKIRNSLLPGMPILQAQMLLRVGTTAEDITPAHHMMALAVGWLSASRLSPSAHQRMGDAQTSNAGQRVAFGIGCSSDCVEREVNAEQAPDCPVRDTVAGEIEEEPGGNHHYGGDGARACGRSRQS